MTKNNSPIKHPIRRLFRAADCFKKADAAAPYIAAIAGAACLI